MVYRLIALFLLMVTSTLSQQGNTVFAKIISAAVTDSTETVVPSKYMVGQPYHMALAIFSDRPTRTCSVIDTAPPSFVGPALVIEGSYDGTRYTVITLYSRPITPSSSSATDSYRLISSASGAFPFIRLSISNWNTVDCQVDVFYSGTIQSLDIKKYTSFGDLYDILRTTTFSIAGIGTTSVAGGITNGKPVIYGWTFNNTVTTATFNNVTIQDVRSDASVTNLLTLTNLASGAVVQSPNTNFPLLAGSIGGTINIVTTNPAAFFSGSVIYRIE